MFTEVDNSDGNGTQHSWLTEACKDTIDHLFDSLINSRALRTYCIKMRKDAIANFE